MRVLMTGLLSNKEGALEKFAALVYFSLAEKYSETVVSEDSDWQAEEAAFAAYGGRLVLCATRICCH